MAAKASMEHLPNEILDIILVNEVLSVKDVCNFGATCSRFKIFCNSNETLWKAKFHQRCPELSDFFAVNGAHTWLNLCRNVDRIDFCVQRDLGKIIISKKCVTKNEVWNIGLQMFADLMNTHEYGYHFMVVYLARMQGNGTATHADKLKAMNIICYIRKKYWIKLWHQFLHLPSEEQILDKGIYFVAQFCRQMSDVDSRSVDTMTYIWEVDSELDDLANEVKTVLREIDPNHPLFDASPEALSEWRSKNIGDNQWQPTESRQILTALCNVFFGRMEFHAGREAANYDVGSSFVDFVFSRSFNLKCPMILSAIVASVARRVGILLKPVGNYLQYLLSWRVSYKLNPETAEPSQCFYVNLLNYGHVLSRQCCPRSSYNGRCPRSCSSKDPIEAVRVICTSVTELEGSFKIRFM